MRELQERELVAKLHELHAEGLEGGYRMLADDLADLGYQVIERRMWRLYRKAGNRSVINKRKRKHTSAGPPVHDDLVQRNFTTEQPNQLWLTDITEHQTGEGKFDLSAVKDVFSNRIMGYSIDARMKAQLAP